MAVKYKIGIMQGRLTEPKGRGIQFFPFENWENEFFTAQKLGLDEIEFIFDYENYKENPLWTLEGRKRIQELIKKTGIKVNAVCFDYFMRRPFYKEKGEAYKIVRNENTEIVNAVLNAMEQIGIGLIEIPLVDYSSLKNEKEMEMFQKWLKEIVEQHNTIQYGLETDLPPLDFLKYLKKINLPQVGANYDSGNSSGMGYDPFEEVTTLRNYILNIHIKDKVYQGSTVELGTGSADFDKLFRGLKEINYQKNFILQAARGEEGKEEDAVARQIGFVTKWMILRLHGAEKCLKIRKNCLIE